MTKENSPEVRVRIAPSPTGDPHVGTAYIALFNMIFARHTGGKFVLRIEDTDQARSRPAYEKNIFDALRWCGIEWDEGPDIGGPYGPYRQSERFPIYKEYAEELVKKQKAYYCFCSQEDLEEMREIQAKGGARLGYDRRCRNLTAEEIKEKLASSAPYVIRLKMPLSGDCIYEDVIKGRITFPWADVDDQVLLKSDGFPTYHLACVVDDHLMKISHVMRGDEWMSSTPKHVWLYDSFGWDRPIFLHMPLLLGRDGKKLSKRRNPTSIFYFRDAGFLQEAFINFLTLMGYSMTGDREIYSLEEIVREFDLKRIGVSGAIFDMTKLEWINQQYILTKIPQDLLWDRIRTWGFSDTFMKRLMPLVHSRIKTFGEFIELTDFLFINRLQLKAELFEVKEGNPHIRPFILQSIIWYLDQNENWSASGINEASKKVAELFSINHKKVVMPLLFASIMGKLRGPPLFDSFELLGKDKARVRLLQAIDFLGGISSKKGELLKRGFDKNDLQDFLKEGEG